jgi:predicted aspartyl protease
MTLRRALLIALLLAPLVARANEPVASVPYRIDYGGWFTVSAMVNGRGPFDFIIDTGATQTLVFKKLDAQLALPSSGGPPQTVLGIAAAGRFPTYRVAEIAIGPLRLEDLATVVLDDWTVGGRSPDGVLGLDFLTRYFLIFDRGRLELRFYENRGSLEVDAPGWRATELRRRTFNLDKGALFTVDAYPDSRRIRFIIDLGATGTIINEQALGRLERAGEMAVSVNPSRGETGSRVTDALSEKARARAVKVRSLRIGRTRWYSLMFTAFDAPIFAELDVQQQAYGLLGADLFHDRSFALDFRGEQLFIGPKR